MKLAQGEQLLKEWNYASKRQKGEKQSASLTVTSKRIVSEVKGNLGMSRQEISLESVKSLFMKNRTPSKPPLIFSIILGIAMAIAGVALAVKFEFPYCYILTAFGGVIAIWNAILLSKIGFSLTITTKGVEGESMTLGESSLIEKKKKTDGKIKIKVDKAVVKDIFDSLGAIIATYQK